MLAFLELPDDVLQLIVQVLVYDATYRHSTTHVRQVLVDISRICRRLRTICDSQCKLFRLKLEKRKWQDHSNNLKFFASLDAVSVLDVSTFNDWAPAVLLVHRLPNLVDVTIRFGIGTGTQVKSDLLTFDEEVMAAVSNLPVQTTSKLQRVSLIGASPALGLRGQAHLACLLRMCQSAHTITFLQCKFTPSAFAALAQCKSVQRLVLHGQLEPTFAKRMRWVDKQFAGMWAALTQLREATVWLGAQCKLTVPQNHKGIHTLCLQHCPFTAAQLQRLVEQSPGLRRLALHGLTQDDLVHAVLTPSSPLAYLELCEGSVRTTTFSGSAAHVPALAALGTISLDIRRVTDCSDLIGALSACKHLSALRLNYGHALTDDNMRRLLVALGSHLRVLDLNFCSALTDATATLVATHCTQLSALAVSGTKISPSGLSYVAKACRHLNLFDTTSRMCPSQSALLRMVLATSVPRAPRRRSSSEAALQPYLLSAGRTVREVEADQWPFPDLEHYAANDALVRRIDLQM